MERRGEKSPCREKGTAVSREITAIKGTLLNQEIFGAVAPRPGPCKRNSRPQIEIDSSLRITSPDAEAANCSYGIVTQWENDAI
jgi:hypothetical protein